jgi:prepilin-type processing-associated H-X9-DG protein
VELCPALNYFSPRFKLKAAGAAYGYGVNLHLTAPLLASVSPITRTADLGLFADAAQVNTFQAPASPEHPLLEEFYYVHALEPTAHFRHQGKANLVFLDGHVGGETAVAGSINADLPEARVGRLRPECLRVR